jgi:hypothetical protein
LTEGFTRSLIEPDGPWRGFADDTVRDTGWRYSPKPSHLVVERSAAGGAERALLLAVLRGAMLDLLATGDRRRTAAAVLLTFRRWVNDGTGKR